MISAQRKGFFLIHCREHLHRQDSEITREFSTLRELPQNILCTAITMMQLHAERWKSKWEIILRIHLDALTCMDVIHTSILLFEFIIRVKILLLLICFGSSSSNNNNNNIAFSAVFQIQPLGENTATVIVVVLLLCIICVFSKFFTCRHFPTELTVLPPRASLLWSAALTTHTDLHAESQAAPQGSYCELHTTNDQSWLCPDGPPHIDLWVTFPRICDEVPLWGKGGAATAEAAARSSASGRDDRPPVADAWQCLTRKVTCVWFRLKRWQCDTEQMPPNPTNWAGRSPNLMLSCASG